VTSNIEPDLRNTLNSFVDEFMLTSKMKSLGGKYDDLLVELGIARFKKHEGVREAEITERLVIAALSSLFNDEKNSRHEEGSA
jgi:hypothetical protein